MTSVGGIALLAGLAGDDRPCHGQRDLRSGYVAGCVRLLGAFAAGVVTKLLLSGAGHRGTEVIDAKLEAVGFGFLVPIFFVNTWLTFDLNALLSSSTAPALLPAVLIPMLVVRGLPGLLTAPPGSAAPERAFVLFSATRAPIIVADESSARAADPRRQVDDGLRPPAFRTLAG